MTVNPLPPQAYTKDTLQKAYSWLLQQNVSVKDMATNQDMLVSMYLKTQRSGEGALDTPSIQNFKSELKNLSSMMGGLQPEPSKITSVTQSTTQSISLQTSTTQHNQLQLDQLDEQSLLALADVKATLNLSSDLEALRSLIALGYKQFKKM